MPDRIVGHGEIDHGDPPRKLEEKLELIAPRFSTGNHLLDFALKLLHAGARSHRTEKVSTYNAAAGQAGERRFRCVVLQDDALLIQSDETIGQEVRQLHDSEAPRFRWRS
jgi:hypothetical protein